MYQIDEKEEEHNQDFVIKKSSVLKKDSNKSKDNYDVRNTERNNDKKKSFKSIDQNLCYNDNFKNISSI